MKRAALGHPKMNKLARILHLAHWGAVGIMESIWQFTAKHAIQGNIGRWTDKEIADGIEWGGDTSRLISALEESGFLDYDSQYRFLVHDWPDHADQSVRKTLHSKGLKFIEGSHRGRTGVAQGSPRGDAGVEQGSPTPTDTLKPKVSDSQIDTTNVSGTGIAAFPSLSKPLGVPPLPPKGEPTEFDIFWKAYPRKTGKGAAKKSWEKAKEKPPIADILTAVQRQIKSEQWQKDHGQFIPLPATWLNQERWGDELTAPTVDDCPFPKRTVTAAEAAELWREVGDGQS
jgi:hypothetical protein